MKRQKNKTMGRKRRALQAFVWVAVLLAANILLNVAPLFVFQAKGNMETELGIRQTRVIWEETDHWGRWDGKFRYLAANEEVAVFSDMYYALLYGWENGGYWLVDLGTEDPIYAQWGRGYREGTNETLWLMGYVSSDEVASIEYYAQRRDGAVEHYVIPEGSYFYHGDDKYYVYDTGAPLSWPDPVEPYWHYIREMKAIARDQDGNILYQDDITWPKESEMWR